ncbi:hypothetical protein G5C51_19660, partial [Streptomyces sp. A7024]|nr:hypothetical protein [Streptomyces coryli]
MRECSAAASARTPAPAPVVPAGVAFAELAVADTEPLHGMLAALGFSRTGRHSAKPV